MKIRAAVTDGKGSFKITEVNLQSPGSGEVLVRLKASGICHTDYDHDMGRIVSDGT
ncbi:MAG: hypothetical protein MK132_17870 [Lentisphaerales bacterium]|nr:hypothetical protein [Lentisphaerales bacterium]